MITATKDEIMSSTPSSPAPSVSPSIADSTPNSLLSAMTFTSSSAGVVKAAAEHKALKRELYRTQHQLRLAKIDLERERADRLREKSTFEARIRDLEEKLREANHDIEFINEAEEQAKQDLEKFRSKTTATERDLRAEITSLKQKLTAEQDARIEAEERTAKLLTGVNQSFQGTDPAGSTFENLMQQWKARIQELQENESILTTRVNELEQENAHLKSNEAAMQDYQMLNRVILSTFSDLEEAKAELQRRRSEIEHISIRIGSVVELEEALRTATVELNRLKTERLPALSASAEPVVCQQIPASAIETLRIATLTAELAKLREELSFTQEQFASTKSELEAKSEALVAQQTLLKDTRKRIFELEARLKKQ